MYKELLERMIDDRLEEQQADRAHIHVTPDEIDRAIANIAARAQEQKGDPVTVEQVVAEVRSRGVSESEFRDEMRRQVLEGKLLELRVRPRVRVTEQDAHVTYSRWAKEMQAEQPVELRILALRVMPGSTMQQRQARLALAQTIASQVQADPTTFCNLVAQYTDDVPTRATCGSRGPQAFASLPVDLQNVAQTVKVGTASAPVTMHVGADEVIVIAMPMGAVTIPSYESVKDQMMQRAMLEGLERARKQWLDELRHKVYIDVRL
jgi:peptidyl-prolyl cis-trans isomerase SurA